MGQSKNLTSHSFLNTPICELVIPNRKNSHSRLCFTHKNDTKCLIFSPLLDGGLGTKVGVFLYDVNTDSFANLGELISSSIVVFGSRSSSTLILWDPLGNFLL